MTEETVPTAAKKTSFWLDFGPLLIFFAAFLYWRRNHPDEALIWAAGVLAIAATFALLISWVRHRTLSPVLIFSTIVIGGSALIALLTGDKRFIYMKPTFLNALYGVVVIGGVIFGKNVIKLLMGSAFELPDDKWNVLAIRWAIFFFAMAILNEIIWRNFSEDFWAGFKVFGFLPLTILFTLTQIPFLNKFGEMKTD
ncbi:inner membrane-spanning protein YciB [Litorimonas sp. WD9-15]|uniref:inner membrane-spanning protein YciB n=1 Tax=Litorimonas sp. WD9-15 TaxID=3418716 RepID=UPI003D05E180